MFAHYLCEDHFLDLPKVYSQLIYQQCVLCVYLLCVSSAQQIDNNTVRQRIQARTGSHFCSFVLVQ